MSAEERMWALLRDVTTQTRKGAEVVEHVTTNLKVTEYFIMPPTPEAPPGCEVVDMVFVNVVVDKAKAAARRAEFEAFIGEVDGLAVLMSNGPSYIHLGALLGDQGIALQFIALGHVLGMWTVGRPRDMLLPKGAKILPPAVVEEERKLAGLGFLFAVPLTKDERADGDWGLRVTERRE